MELSKELIQLVEESEHKALATIGDEGPNVVPISMVRCEAGEIIICDCFMGRTVENIKRDARVAAAFWKGMIGIQVKGRVEYLESGDRFGQAAARLKETHPDRVLKGVLILKPEAAYDLSPKHAGAQLI